MNFIKSAFFLALISFSAAKSNVPVLIWNSHGSTIDMPKLSALQVLNYKTFEAKFMDWFNPQNVLIFLQDTLSVEDLSSHADEMKYLHKSTKDDHSVFFPSVQDADHLAHKLSMKKDFNVITLSPGSNVAGLDLNGQKNLIIVKLPSTKTNPSRRKAMKKADEVIESVMSKISNKADFTVLFTGKESSINMEEAEHLRIARSLQQKFREGSDTTPGYHTANCISLYLRKEDISITIDSNSGTIPYDAELTMTSDCQDDKQAAHLLYTDITVGSEKYSKLTVELNFRSDQSYWCLDSGNIDVVMSGGKGIPTSYPLKLTSARDWVPKGMSYSCGRQIAMDNSKSNDTSLVVLKVPSIQVQAFHTEGAPFGNSWDCIGFFSVPIWCGLLASLLSTIILLWGLYMLAEVRTMDRFDDPKGKSIMITNAE